MARCNEIAQLPNISILFGDYYFEVLPEDYINDLRTFGRGCIVMFVKDNANKMVLGVPFMKGFYVVHDLGDLTVGIVPQDSSSKSKGKYGLQPEQEPFAVEIIETFDVDGEVEGAGPNLTPLYIGLGAGGAGLGVMSYFIVKKHKND